MFKWMQQEGEQLHLKEYQRTGALVLDEMSIQEDLTYIHKRCHTYYAGQVVITPHAEALVIARKGEYLNVNVIF